MIRYGVESNGKRTWYVYRVDHNGRKTRISKHKSAIEADAAMFRLMGYK